MEKRQKGIARSGLLAVMKFQTLSPSLGLEIWGYTDDMIRKKYIICSIWESEQVFIEHF